MKIELMVFPVVGYTDIIQNTVCEIFTTRQWLTFTRKQITNEVIQKLDFLKGDLTQHQTTVLDHIISNSIRLMIQRNVIKKVKGPTTVDPEWQSNQGINQNIYKILTSSTDVAKNPNKVSNRALNAKKISLINA